jgi:hypothetical protein
MVDAPENRNGRDGTTNQSGSERHVNDDSEVGDEFKWFDPDGFPSLREAARIIFPSLQASRTGTYQRREGAEAEYEQEISERLRRVSFDTTFVIPIVCWSLLATLTHTNIYSFMLFRQRLLIYPRTWKTLRGTIRQNLLNEPQSDGAKRSQNGEANPN